ncbi:MAG: DUF72 domain-containing protein [Planctomycetota bacterium]
MTAPKQQKFSFSSPEKIQNNIIIGTSGYYYEDWKGNFYPHHMNKKDMLPFYAEHFYAVELNFTYYGIPKAAAVSHMVSAAPDNFFFVVKANKEMTHEIGRDSVYDEFKKAIEPIYNTEKLGGVLAQFPGSFNNESEGRKYITQLRSKMPGYPLIIEFRNKTWQNQQALDLLALNDCAYCCVDEPALPELPDSRIAFTANPAYIRFHSRNASKWYTQDGKERYNYLYNDAELKEWVPKISSLSKQAQKVFIFFNNCYSGYAARNAKQLKKLLETNSIFKS